MNPNLLQGLVALIVIVIAGIGWSGYWSEFQHRVELENKIKKFYGE